jgi:hypothetical protein
MRAAQCQCGAGRRKRGTELPCHRPSAIAFSSCVLWLRFELDLLSWCSPPVVTHRNKYSVVRTPVDDACNLDVLVLDPVSVSVRFNADCTTWVCDGNAMCPRLTGARHWPSTASGLRPQTGRDGRQWLCVRAWRIDCCDCDRESKNRPAAAFSFYRSVSASMSIRSASTTAGIGRGPLTSRHSPVTAPVGQGCRRRRRRHRLFTCRSTTATVRPSLSIGQPNLHEAMASSPLITSPRDRQHLQCMQHACPTRRTNTITVVPALATRRTCRPCRSTGAQQTSSRARACYPHHFPLYHFYASHHQISPPIFSSRATIHSKYFLYTPL